MSVDEHILPIALREHYSVRRRALAQLDWLQSEVLKCPRVCTIVVLLQRQSAVSIHGLLTCIFCDRFTSVIMCFGRLCRALAVSSGSFGAPSWSTSTIPDYGGPAQSVENLRFLFDQRYSIRYRSYIEVCIGHWQPCRVSDDKTTTQLYVWQWFSNATHVCDTPDVFPACLPNA
jgi:hypothetical protein